VLFLHVWTLPPPHSVFCSFINGPRDELSARDCAGTASWRVPETAAAQEVQARNAAITVPQYTNGYAKNLAHKKFMLAACWRENPPPTAAGKSTCSWQ
jgi:hypothetical protein